MVRGRSVLLWAGLGVLLVTIAAARPQPAAAAPQAVAECIDAAYELIGLVNGVRTAAGQPAFEINGTLMAVAQAHSEYQASINAGTHTGPGGSRPYDRVKAAGYGDGRHIYVSENIAWGYNLTPQGAIDVWLPSPPHYRTMTGPLYHDVGAGCARSGKQVYFTLVAAGIAGQALAPTPRPPTGPTATPPPPTPTLPYEPVLPATPRPDGAVIHTVRRGQTLMMIAGSYRVPLEDILRYNNLTENSILRIGQEIIVVPPRVTSTPTSDAADSAVTATPRAATATATTTATTTPRSPARTRPQPTATATTSSSAGTSGPRPLDLALALGLTFALAGYWMARRQLPS